MTKSYVLSRAPRWPGERLTATARLHKVASRHGEPRITDAVGVKPKVKT